MIVYTGLHIEVAQPSAVYLETMQILKLSPYAMLKKALKAFP